MLSERSQSQRTTFYMIIFVKFCFQSCPILCDPMDYSLGAQAPLPMGFSRQEYCTGLPFRPQGMFTALGSNLCLLHWRKILYLMSLQRSPNHKRLHLYNPFYRIGKSIETERLVTSKGLGDKWNWGFWVSFLKWWKCAKIVGKVA